VPPSANTEPRAPGFRSPWHKALVYGLYLSLAGMIATGLGAALLLSFSPQTEFKTCTGDAFLALVSDGYAAPDLPPSLSDLYAEQVITGFFVCVALFGICTLLLAGIYGRGRAGRGSES